MASRPVKAAAALVAIALLGAIFWWWGRPRPLPVSVRSAEPGPVEASVANTRAGTVEACQRTRLSTIIGGRIEVLAVKEGDRVEAGQLLMKLWNDDQKAQQQLAQAQVDLARRRVDEACIVAANARREADRQSQLRARGFVSLGKEDTARTEALAREAACATTRADVAQAQARERASRVEQGRTMLVAPFAGTVARIVGELGEYSTPSPPGVPTPPAIDLIDDSCLLVKAPMDEVDAPRIQVGMPARVTLDALPGKTFAGRVKRIAPVVTALEKQARTVEIEVEFMTPVTGELRVGYSADVDIVLATRSAALRIPTAALQEGRRVLVLEAGRLAERAVKPGIGNWEYTEIQEGLAAGEAVVTSLEKPGVKAGAAAEAVAAPPRR